MEFQSKKEALMSEPLTCPHCKTCQNKENFFRLSHDIDTLLYRIPPKGSPLFAKGPTKQLFACPNCGIAFIDTGQIT